MNPESLIGQWGRPAIISQSNFKFKSLCEWVFNTTIGCRHGCRFCYVPDVSVNKQKGALAQQGVTDPEGQWGDYVYVRAWDEKAFRSSLAKAEKTNREDLKPDGHRAVMLSSTCDPYQVFRGSDTHHQMVGKALELIRDESTLNVRILTRGPLAKKHFELYQGFGNRLLFGMSLPSLNEKLVKLYEPNAPSPAQRLKTLQEAQKMGIPVYVAMAPTFPECDEADIRKTLTELQKLDPVTVFHEPINIRSDNAARISKVAEAEGIVSKSDVLQTPESWETYALEQMQLVEVISEELKMRDKIHFWPDQALISRKALERHHDPTGLRHWVQSCWEKVSDWPGEE